MIVGTRKLAFESVQPPLLLDGVTAATGVRNASVPTAQVTDALSDIRAFDAKLLKKFHKKMEVRSSLNRQLVSFQANKTRPRFRWYKYKEGFSAALVESLLESAGLTSGTVLDPFAGSGTTLFVCQSRGLDSDGIELLPIGQESIETRLIIEKEFKAADIATLRRWTDERPWINFKSHRDVPELRITRGAYPPQTCSEIGRYLHRAESESARVQRTLRYALLCILEAVSFTRKDGQYLRWDSRSGRRYGHRAFDKGPIARFDEAVVSKLREILADIQEPSGGNLFAADCQEGEVGLLKGSCLDILPTLKSASYSGIITSPPYCNRYDYTRTYALELALLNVGEEGLVELRQQMLSCTVENRAKDLLALNPKWKSALSAADNQELLQTILSFLDGQRLLGALNNNGIPRMIRGYFYEMACVISECARVLKKGAPFFMVNDNVRYAGAPISVDLILSDLAEHLGFDTEEILILPDGKGNSSQQMGEHGKDLLRKCVYVWRKR